MKNWERFILFSFFIFVSAFITYGQSITKISQRCPAPNGSLSLSVQGLAIGDILHTPCPARASIFTGNVDFSGATIIGGGFITGTGTANFMPRFTGASSIGNTPMSWNGTSFEQNNTALNSEFTGFLTPSTAAGVARFGDCVTTATNCWTLTQSTNTSQLNATTISNQVTNAAGVWNVTDATNFSTVFNASTDVWNVINTTSDNRIEFTSTAGGSLTLGDCTTTINDCFQQIYGTGNTTITAAASVKLQDPAAATFLELNTAGDLITLQSNLGIAIGNAGGTGTQIFVDPSSSLVAFRNTTNTARVDFSAVSTFNLQCTNTPAGTTGNQNIDKPCGSVNFAIAATEITITNNTALATSNIFCTVQDVDVTAISCRVTNRLNGSFRIRIPAATAETPVAFWVLN